MTRVCIIGSGWGGYSAARRLLKGGADVTLVSPRNHFLFTPLLASTSVGTVEYRAIMETVRDLKGIHFTQAHASSLDLSAKSVRCSGFFDGYAFDIPYDRLIVAVGADLGTYGVEGAVEHALPLREAAHARKIRSRIVERFEAASEPGLPEETVRRYLSFVVVGGGPTGVEFAAELWDFLSQDVPRAYPEVGRFASVHLVDAGTKVLSAFDDQLSNYTLRQLQDRNVRVHLRESVAHIGPDAVRLGNGTVIPCGLCLWSGGIAPRPWLKDWPFALAPDGRVRVDASLRPYDKTSDAPLDAVRVIGDCAALEQPLPATAQVAAQQGVYAAEDFLTPLAAPAPPFAYRHLGILAYTGGYRAVAETPGGRLSGVLAWVLWRSAYMTRLVSVRNKILVPMNWIRALLFGRDTSYF